MATSLLTLVSLSVIGMQSALAATCSSTSFTWAATSTLTYQSGGFCVQRKFNSTYELTFDSHGDLALYGNAGTSGKPVWSSGTSDRGENLQLNKYAVATVLGCAGTAGTGCTAKSIWNSQASTQGTNRNWTKYMIQIGVNANTDDACWAIVAYDGTEKSWFGGPSWPTSGLCTGTYAADGGSAGGGGWE
jgi:hypothetical protein